MVNTVSGHINLDRSFFKPSEVFHKEYVDYLGRHYQVGLNNMVGYATIDIIYQQLFNGNFVNLNMIQQETYKRTCIGTNGFITPLKKWLIEASYDYPISASNHISVIS